MSSSDRFILSFFDQKGFSLRPNSFSILKQFLNQLTNDQESLQNHVVQEYLEQMLQKIKDIFQHQQLLKNVVDDVVMHESLDLFQKEFLEGGLKQNDTYENLDDFDNMKLQQQQQMENYNGLDKINEKKFLYSVIIVDIFQELPQYQFDSKLGIKADFSQVSVDTLFNPSNSTGEDLFGVQDDQIDMFRNRLLLVRDQLLQSQKYSLKGLNNVQVPSYHESKKNQNNQLVKSQAIQQEKEIPKSRSKKRKNKNNGYLDSDEEDQRERAPFGDEFIQEINNENVDDENNNEYQIHRVEITDISSLRGAGSTTNPPGLNNNISPQKLFIMGMLYTSAVQELFMQDLDGSVKLDVSRATIQSGYLTANCIAIAEGFFDEQRGYFDVEVLHQPEWETRGMSKFRYPTQDLFGASEKMIRTRSKLVQLELERSAQMESSTLNQNSFHFNNNSNQNQQRDNVYDSQSKNMEILENDENTNLGNKNRTNHTNKAININNRLQAIARSERRVQNSMGLYDLQLIGQDGQLLNYENRDEYCVVLLSDFTFNDRGTLKKLELMLEGFKGSLYPLCFILMGRIFSYTEICSQDECIEVKECLREFLRILDRFKNFKEKCFWFIVPHLNDLGLNVLPQPGLPESLFQDVVKEVPFFRLLSNPGRLTVLGREFYVARIDLLKDLRQNSVVVNDSQDFAAELVNTIISQSHLSPIGLYSKPIFWQNDQALEIQRLPNFLILGQGFTGQFDYQIGADQVNQDTTFVINPGSFSKSFFTVVYPLQKDSCVQQCSLDS